MSKLNLKNLYYGGRILMYVVIAILLLILILKFKIWFPFSFEKGPTKTEILNVLGEAIPNDIRVIAEYEDSLNLTIFVPVIVKNNRTFREWAKTKSWMPEAFKDEELVSSSTLGEKWNVRTNGKVFVGYTTENLPYDMENVIVDKTISGKWNITIGANLPCFVSKDFGLVPDEVYSRSGLFGHSISPDSLNSMLDQALYTKFDSLARVDIDLQAIACEYIMKDIQHQAILFGLDVEKLNVIINFEKQNLTLNNHENP